MPRETAARQNVLRQPPDMSRLSTDDAKCVRTRKWLVVDAVLRNRSPTAKFPVSARIRDFFSAHGE